MDIDWAQFIQTYGYFAIIVGAFFEGETVMVLGAYAVQQEIFNFWWLILAGTLGAFIGDQFYYQVGAKVGYKFVNDRPKLADKFNKASSLIDKYPTMTILCMRFAWGLRTIIPISFGVKKFNLIHYMIANLIASVLWSFIVVTIGIKITHWLHQLWDHLLHNHHSADSIIVITLILVCAVIGLYKLIGYLRLKK